MLQNANFEADWSNGGSHDALVIVAPDAADVQQFGNIFTPPGWLTWFRHIPEIYAQPKVKDARAKDPDRMRSGEKGLLLFTFCRRHDAGLLQQVSTQPGQRLRFSAWAHAWSNWEEGLRPHDPRWSDHERDGYLFVDIGLDEAIGDGDKSFTFAVGIDPAGGINPLSSSVVWGESRHIYGGWNGDFGELTVEATAAAGQATVFLRSTVLNPFTHCDAYWDDAMLEVVGDSQPDCPGAPRVQYQRTYVLLPPDASAAWARAVVDASWDDWRWTLGGSADDAGIGPLDDKRVIAVNPDRWPSDLEAFFEEHYPGTLSRGVYASTPTELYGILTSWDWDEPGEDWSDIVLSQRDPLWANHRFGAESCTAIISSDGCYITGLAMAQRAMEIRVDATPVTIDAALGPAGYYNCRATWSGIRDRCGMTVSDTGDLDNHLSDGCVALLRVSPADPEHFVLAVGQLNDDYVILDPWHGDAALLSDRYTGYQSFRLLTPNGSPLPPPTPVMDWGNTNALMTIHLQAGTEHANTFVRDAKPRYAKVFGWGDCDWIKANSPDTRVVMRVWADDKIGRYMYELSPEEGAEEFYQIIRPGLESIAPLFSDNTPIYVETPLNETAGAENPDHYIRTAAFDAAWAYKLASCGLPARAVVLTIPIGNPPGDQQQVEYLLSLTLPAVVAACQTGGALGYHAYYGASPARDWLESTWRYMAGRWTWMDEYYRSQGYYPLWLLGEGGACASKSGCDLAWSEGWRGPNCMENDWPRYLASLQQFQELIRQWNAQYGERCGGVALFTSPGWEPWETFGLLGPELLSLSQNL